MKSRIYDREFAIEDSITHTYLATPIVYIWLLQSPTEREYQQNKIRSVS